MEKQAKDYGRAYALMDFKASKEEIESELPFAREAARTPSQLEILVREIKDLKTDRTVDSDLVKYIGENSIYPMFPEKFKAEMKNAKPIKMSDLRYMLEAKYPNATNEEAAEQINAVSNYLFYTFGDNKPLNYDVIGKAPDGQYNPWRND